MSSHRLIALGTSSALPTKVRNHNGYLLRWGSLGVLFDCGEGTQRQLLHAGVSSRQIDLICLTHLHGDHCLGLPGVLQRISLDTPGRRVTLAYPEEGQEYIDRLRSASLFYDQVDLTMLPIPAYESPQEILRTAEFILSAASLNHRVPTVGYRVTDLPGISFDAKALASRGITGPAVGRLRRDGAITIDGVTTQLAEVSQPRRTRSFAFIMDTAPCENAVALAQDADLVVMEATYTDEHAELAQVHGHSTASQAARIAEDAHANVLALTHFSTRYANTDQHLEQARSVHPGTIALADLDQVPLPLTVRQ